MTRSLSVTPSPGELHHVLEWGRGPTRPVPAAVFSTVFAAAAAAAPSAPAVVAGSSSLTYGRLRTRVDALATRLRLAGVGPEQRVGLCLPRTAALVEAMLAVLQAGGAFVPLDPALPGHRLAAMATQAAPMLCLVTGSSRASLPAGDWGVLDLDTLDAELDTSDADSAAADEPAAHPTDLAYILFTSGSTGQPKGICIEQRSLVDFAVTNAEVYGVHPGSRVLALASVGFDVSIAEIFTVLAVGATVVIADGDDRHSPLRLRELLTGERITVAELPPSLLGLLDPADFPDLELVSVGGEAPSPSPVAQWVRAGKRLVNAYGPTETTVTATFFDCTKADFGERDAVVPIGRPRANHRAYVLDEAGELVAPGEPGELWVSGPGVAREYLDLPDLTAARFRPDPFDPRPSRMYGTGDVVAWNPYGQLEFRFRLDNQLNLRGFRIEAGEVETRLRAHRTVDDAAVVVGGRDEGARLVAFVVPRRGVPESDVTGADLPAWCRRTLPAYMAPSTVFTVPALPLTAAGKVDRHLLTQRASGSGTPDGDQDAGRGALSGTAERVLRIWRESFPATTAFGLTDNFYDIGGHSLLAMRIQVRIRAEFGVDLALTWLAERPTVAGLAVAIDDALSVGTESAGVELVARGLPTAPLSFAQQRFWFLDQLAPGEPTYNLPVCLRLRGSVDPDRLETALAAVVAKHPSLRTSFATVDGQPVTRVAPAVEVRLPVDDLRQLPATDRRTEHDHLVRALVEDPLPLDEAPLWRARLIRSGQQDWTLVLVVHHAVADGWSLSLLLTDLGAVYRGELPESVDAAPGALQYGDFAGWQRTVTATSEGARKLEHWHRVLAGVPTVLDLPADRRRPEKRTAAAGVVRGELPGRLAAEIARLARRHRTTPYAAMLSVFASLLGRLAGTDDLLVACPVAGRPVPELAGMVGFFVDSVPVRIDLSGAPTVTELVRRTAGSVVDAIAHADVPFDHIVAAVAPPRDMSRNPLVQIGFNQLDYPAEELRLPGVRVEPLPVDPPGSLLDATLYLRAAGDGLALELVYNRAIFDADRMAEFLRQYEWLLEQAVGAPGDLPVAALSLVTPAAEAVLPDPVARLGAAAGLPLLQQVERWVRATPEAVAVQGADRAVTYAELGAIIRHVAARLAAAGVGHRDRVAVCAARSTLLPSALLAIRSLGATAVLIDAGHPPARQRAMVRATGPVAWLDLDGSGLGAPLADHLAEQRIPRLSVTGDASAAVAGHEPVAERRDDPAFVLFTSGSTGEPNAVSVPAAALPHFADWYGRTFGIGPTDRFSMISGVAHDPVLRDALVPLCFGATVCVPPTAVHRAPDLLARWIRDARVTVAHLTPQHARMLARAVRTDRAGDPSAPADGVRLIACSGDVLLDTDLPALASLAPGAELVGFYGATETPQAVAWQPLAGQQDRPGVPLGVGIDDVQLLVVNPAGHRAGVGELGEICVRTAYLATGYLGDDARTDARFALDPGPERRYRTGDLGRYLPDGRVEISGRSDDQVKIRGFRVEPAEVTAVLARAPGVVAAAVVMRTDAAGEPELVGYVVVDGTASPRELLGWLRNLLPEWSVPRAIVDVPIIPLTSNGKVDTAALPAPSTPVPTVAAAAPSSDLERAIADIWCRVLGLVAVGLDDSFFDVGGNSLRLVDVQHRLQQLLARPVSVVELFQFPTVRRLAAQLSAEPAASTPRSEATVRRIDQRRLRRSSRGVARPATRTATTP